MIRINNRAFIANWSEITRWDPVSFHDMVWHWPAEVLRPIGSVLKVRKEKVDRTKYDFSQLTPITIHFGGTISKRNVEGKNYSMELFFARPGDVVLSKIDLKNGAVTLVPDDWENVVITGHFATYEPDRSQLLPAYFTRIIQAKPFKELLWRNKTGGEGRKEVKLDFFLSTPVPLPVQAAMVEAYETGMAEAARLRQEAARLERERQQLFRDMLGLAELPPMSTSKVLTLQFSKLDLWGLQSARSLQRIAGLQKANYPFFTGEDFLLSVKNGCSDAPSFNPTSLEVLKISGVTKGKLDLTQRKFIADEPAYRRNFDLRAGDVLMCRTNGTLGMVGMSALVEDDLPGMIYPDKVIRLRANPEMILPAFLWRALQLPYVRAQIEAAARTAVGNYAIGGADVWALKVPLPPLELQQQLITQDERLRASAQAARTRAAETEAAAVARVEEMILGITQPL